MEVVVHEATHVAVRAPARALEAPGQRLHHPRRRVQEHAVEAELDPPARAAEGEQHRPVLGEDQAEGPSRLPAEGGLQARVVPQGGIVEGEGELSGPGRDCHAHATENLAQDAAREGRRQAGQGSPPGGSGDLAYKERQ